MDCPKCSSQKIESGVPTEGGIGIGAQVGSVVLGLVALPLGPVGIFVGLNVGGLAGGYVGWKLTAKNECKDCGHRWV
jgi:phage tail tape-measure protein